MAALHIKLVPAEGDVWQGVPLPGGAKIGVSVWGAMRRRDVWGADTDEFRPERWLEATPEKRREMDSSSGGFDKLRCEDKAEGQEQLRNPRW